MRNWTLIPGLIFFLLAFASAAADAGPCSLVTAAEVQAATGVAVAEGKVNSINKQVCDYKASAAGSLINLMLTDKGPGDSAERTVAELAKRRLKAEVAAGIGDGAYRSSPGYGMQQMGAYKGTKHVVVTALLAGAPEAKTKAAIEAVMRKALARVQ